MKQIEIAKQLVGQREGANNTFDDTTKLGKMVRLAGQKSGEAWCSYVQEAIFCEAYPEKEKVFRELFSAGAVQTFNNFKAAGYEISKVPKPGYLVIWQRWKDGKATWQGHAGLVDFDVDGPKFKAYEGNTNEAGSREGTTFLLKNREDKKVDNGLNVLGFIKLV